VTSNSETKLLSNQDLELKLKVNAIFRKQRCVVFNEVDLCTFSYQPKYERKHITDIDSLGLCCDSDLFFRNLVAECKSVEEKAMESLLKLRGTMDFFKADKAYFVQKKMDINAREIGREMGLYCLDEPNIDSLLASLGLTDVEILKVERELYKIKRQLILRMSTNFQSQTNYLRYNFWIYPNHRNIVNLLRLLDVCGKSPQRNNKDEKSFVVYHLTLLLLISILKLCSALIRMNIGDVADGTKTLIMGGSRERRDREALFDEVSKLTKQHGLIAYPIFLESLTELVKRYILSLIHSAPSLLCFENILNGILLKDYSHIWGNPFSTFHEKTIKLTRDVIYFVISNTSLEKSDYSAILSD
jgi:hypothetical protein